MEKRIKFHKTPIDDKNEYREYFVDEKDGVFITGCIGWRVIDMTRSGGGQDYHEEFKTEEEAIKKYNELIEAWEDG